MTPAWQRTRTSEQEPASLVHGPRSRAVVAALIVLAASPDHRDRADAWCSLAGFAEVPETGESGEK